MPDPKIEGMMGSLHTMMNEGLNGMAAQQAALPTSDPPVEKTAAEANAERFLAMFETAFLVAACDGKVADEELAQMASSMNEIAAGRLPREAIDGMFQDYSRVLQRDGFEKRLAHIASVISDPQERRLAFVLAAGTAHADGKVVDEELALFSALATNFAIPREEAQHLLHEVQKKVQPQRAG